MLNRTEKEQIIEDLKKIIDKSQAIFLTNLIGIGSNDANNVRKNVRNAGGKLVITRNTLFERAAKGTPSEKLLTGLKGPTAVAFAFNDAAAVAKALKDASGELEKVELRSGLLGDKMLSKAEVTALASLPSRDQMLGTTLATMMAPVSSFVRVLDAIRVQKEEVA